GQEPAVEIAGIAVGMVGMGAEDADMAVLLEPAHHPVVRDVAPQEIAAVAEIDRPLGPAEAGGDALDRGIALLGKTLVELLDTRIGIARARQGAQRQLRALCAHHRFLPVVKALLTCGANEFRPSCCVHSAGRRGYTIPA